MRICWATLWGLALATALPAQLPDLHLPDLGGLAGGIKTLTDGQDPITTTAADTVDPVTFLEGFTPDEATARTAPRIGPNGEWLFDPGIYRLSLLSFCMKPGAWRPTPGGDGYLRAPLKGPKATLVQAILWRSAPRADISQEAVQLLLWAIIARTRLRDMPPETQALARRLLSAAELRQLEPGSLPVLSDGVVDRLVGKLPAFVQELLRRENQVRGLLARGGAYDDVAAAAVAEPGTPPGANASLPALHRLKAPFGSWCHHPAGAFLRYDVESYALTHVWVVIPPPVTITRDRSGRIVALDDGKGRRIETTYRKRGLRFRSDPRLRACAFATVRFTLRQNGAVVHDYVMRNRGWTFVGQVGPAPAARTTAEPQGLGQIVLVQDDDDGGGDDGVNVDDIIDAIGEEMVGDVFVDLKERYEKAKEHKESYDEWKDNVRKVTDGATMDDVNDFFNSKHYQEGLDACMKQDVEGQGDWLGDHVKLSLDAYLYAGNEIARAGDEPTPTPTKPFNPASVTASIKAEMAVAQQSEPQRLSLWQRLVGK